MFRKSAARQCSNLSSFLRSKLFCPRFRRSLSTRRSIYERTVSRSRSLSSTNSLLDSLEENSNIQFDHFIRKNLLFNKFFQKFLVTNLKWKPFLLASCTILIYYFFSISLTFYNRYLFVNYKYPLSITIIHLIVKFTAAVTIRTLLDLTLNSRCGLSKSPRLTLDWSTYLSKVVPLGLASAADIGMSNWSLQYITVTLYTMSKSTVILFILFFSLIFKLEKWVGKLFNFWFFWKIQINLLTIIKNFNFKRRSIILIIGCISFGLFLFTFHSTEFNLFGFILVMIASMCSGLRWTLAQTLCQKHDMGLSNPVDMIYHIQPSMILALLPLALYVEGVSVISTEKFFRTDDLHQIASNMQWIMIGAFIAFFLESSEFLVVTFTSSLTLSVSGIFKVSNYKQSEKTSLVNLLISK